MISGMTWLSLIEQVGAAFIGTVAFALLFGVPKKYYLMCGIVAAIGWLLYYLLSFTPLSATECTFFATLLVILLSRYASVWMRCPVTVFLTTGIFPLIPGGGIYWTTYYMVMGETSLASESGFNAIKAVLAIVLGIVIVLELPRKMFVLPRRRSH